VVALEQSLAEIARRHETLRTTFPAVDGRPVQAITPKGNEALPILDLRMLEASERETEVERLVAVEARQPFDLARSPVWRAKLLRLSEEEYVLLLTMHHIASDGWSMGVIYRELSVLYNAFVARQPSPLADLPIQYVDFAVWQRQYLRGEVLERQLSYWRQQLAGAPTVLELPLDRPRPPVQTYRGARETLLLSRPVAEGLWAVSHQQGATLFMTLLAAFQALLGRYSGQQQIVVGSPIANRTRPEMEGLIGFFVNTLALRTDLSGDLSFRQLLARVREVCLGAYAHPDLPFEKLVEELQLPRSLSHSPLFQVLFVLQNAPRAPLELAGLTHTALEIDSGMAKFDLSLFVVETPHGLKAVMEYNTDLFEAETIQRMLGHYQVLLEGIVADPEQRLSELPLLTAAERQQLLVEWNRTEAHYPHDECIHQLIETQVERTPEAVAVVCGEDQLTYRELNARANQVAHYLKKRGVGPDRRVGLCVERSLQMVVGMLGILKAGGAYLPLDLAFPRERLAFVLADAQATVVVTQERWIDQAAVPATQVVYLDSEGERIARCSEQNPNSGVAPGHLAYVIYTSGSTGQPKGVAIEHRSTIAFLDWARTLFTPEQLAGVLASTSLCFDLSVFELLVPLCWGGTVILAENALQLPALPAAGEVTLINTVPSAIAELLRVDGVPPSVTTINLAGEPLPNSLAQEIYQKKTVQHVLNLYGPTEDTIYSTYARVEKGSGSAVPIGRPIANTQLYVLDQHLQPVPVGIPGELHLGGAGLARGYLNQPELTAEKFIPHPFSDDPEARLYKTGDRVRYRPDGNLEFLGRWDHQVKIRGYRIELGEIEAVLTQHPAVRECVVLAREDRPGERRLVAYLVPDREGVLIPIELREFLKEKLPEYMVPATLVMLEALPRTPNGKIDRGALPEPDPMRPELAEPFVAPRSPVEERLAGIWAEVLGLERVGVDDDFFELGGHSLLATQVIARARRMFPVELPLRYLFEAPTVAGLAVLMLESLAEKTYRDELAHLLAD
jgi:amino acid adenylation domain-containing protein